MTKKRGLPRVRFQKRIKLLPGIRANLSRSGVSLTGGIKGLSVNTGKDGTYLNAGLPGSGLSTRSRILQNDKVPKEPDPADIAPKRRRIPISRVALLLIVIIMTVAILNTA